MASTVDSEIIEPKKRSKLPLLIGVILSLVGAGGGFYAVNSGMLGTHKDASESEAFTAQPDSELATPFAFVPLDPLVVSLPSDGGRTHLRFSAQLEVSPQYTAEVESIKPRIVDVLNGYLRAVRIQELDDPASLVKLRSQMLRRVQIVAGEGRIRDLLIMEFVLN